MEKLTKNKPFYWLRSVFLLLQVSNSRAREAVYAYCFSGKRYDVGDKLGFLKATVEYALRRPDLGDQFRDYLKSLSL